MSTYTDLHNKIKETINVDYHTRITPQNVKLLNPKNEYLGFFNGKAAVNSGLIENVTLKDSILDNVKFKNGLVLDELNGKLTEMSNNLCTEISDRIIVDQYLENQICSNYLDSAERIASERNRAISVENTLSLNIYKEAQKRKDADVMLSANLEEDIQTFKHFKLNNINDRTYPIKLRDYSINTYKAHTPNAYVYMEPEELPIGRIQNSLFDYDNDDLVYKSFDLYVFENTGAYELTAFGKAVYHFDLENTVIYTGVGGYRIEWRNPGCNMDDSIELYVDSGNKYGFYPVKFENTHNEAGLLQAGEKNIVIDNDGIIQRCKFTVTSKTLSNFVRPYPFELTNKSTVYVKGLDESKCEICLSDNHFILKDGTCQKMYMALSSGNDVFARIYENDIVIDSFDNLDEMTVAMDNRKYILTEATDFTAHVRGSNPYRLIKFNTSDKKVSVIDEKKQYVYKFIGNNSTVIPGDDDVDYNKKINDSYDFMTLRLSFDDKHDPYLNTKYQLAKDLKDPHLYVTKEKFDDVFIKIVFDQIKNTLNIFITNPGAEQKGHILLTLNTVIYKIDDYSVVLFTSQEINIVDPTYDQIEEVSKNSYFLYSCPKSSEMSGETKQYECKSSCRFRDQIDIILPDKKHEIPRDFEKYSMQYYINFKITDNGKYTNKNKVVRLNLISHDLKDKFYYLNKPVKNIFLLKNAYSTLKFDEVQPHRFIITDLDQSELDFRTKALYERLVKDEEKVAKAIDHLSTEISSNNIDIDYLSSQIDTANENLCCLCTDFQIISSDFNFRIENNTSSIDVNDERILKLSSELNDTSSSICLSVGQISAKVNEICSQVSSEIEKLELSVSEISSITTSISSGLSIDLSCVKEHYDSTFIKDHPVDIIEPGKDISVDVLKVTDESIDPMYNGKQYSLHLSCGTLVLVPIEK